MIQVFNIGIMLMTKPHAKNIINRQADIRPGTSITMSEDKPENCPPRREAAIYTQKEQEEGSDGPGEPLKREGSWKGVTQRAQENDIKGAEKTQDKYKADKKVDALPEQVRSFKRREG
jgi:hypothetical protein